jgi:CheY-like chemotaxis protein
MPVKILLADKSITIQKVVEMLFSGRDYEVVCVSDGESALNDAARALPDVVLADVDLPRIDGYTLSARMKQTPALAETPVILMMSRDDVFDSARGKQAGIVDNIAKPFESQELISKVKKAISAAPPRTAEPEHPAVDLKSQRTEQPLPIPPAPTPPPRQNAPTNIFDIIQEAPTEKEIRKAAAPAAPDESEYVVEAEVEEVDEPLVREVEKALPVGDKAMEEMRAGLGLGDEVEEPQSEILSFESFEAALEPAPRDRTPPSAADRTGELVSSAPVTPIESRSSTVPEEIVVPSAPKIAAPSMPSTSLTESDLWSIADETISKMAKAMFEKMPPVQLPQISEETVLKMAGEKVAQLAQEAFAKLPPVQPPQISDDIVRKITEEKIEKLAQDAIAKMPPPRISDDMVRAMAEEKVTKLAAEAVLKIKMPEPPKLSEKELHSMAEATMSLMAADIFKNMPPPPMPKVSDETVRRGLEAVLLKVAREMAREVIEQVAWEVIPPLAELLIKAEIERLKTEP